MTQTTVIRIADFLKSLLPLADAGDAVKVNAPTTPDGDLADRSGKFSREEAYYWSMHAHW